MSVVTYKYDNFTTDEIIVAFEVVERPGELQEVSEEWQGFDGLFSSLQQELGISPDWYQEVVHPPFATNRRVLLQRLPPTCDDGDGHG